MYLNYYLQQLRYILYMAPVLLIAITAHEYAHGWMSERLGDPTPRADGRMSLNPLKHLDLVGTLCLLFFHMGWAKPVRINTRYYRDRRKGIILVSLAGPVMNFILAFISVLLSGLLLRFGNANSELIQVLYLLCYYSAVMNTGLGVFNLIPFPPLDGSNVLEQLIPRVGYFYERIRPYRSMILLILLVSGALSRPLTIANNTILGGMWETVQRILGFGVQIQSSGGGTIL
ncbi:peptidase [Sellimonas catena]|uniref:Peptidase n=2 Tax=Sellimonas catena TaxID=2994035 RepID=A0A9W6CC58_9FIRM|nr:peptidase [Sellimonas catena]